MPQRILAVLEELDIKYINYNHQPVISCDEAKGIDVPGKRVKSLLIRNKKKTQFYMVILADNKQLDTNLIRTAFGDTKMTFSSQENMDEKIAVKIGSVSPFALINNTDSDVKVVFDRELQGIEIGFHPLKNDQTIVLNMDDVEKFFRKYWERVFLCRFIEKPNPSH